MDYSSCFDNLARYSVVGFGVFGVASLLFAKRTSRFNWMLFGTGIGAGYGAFDCKPSLFDEAPNVDVSRLYQTTIGFFKDDTSVQDSETKGPSNQPEASK
jgi:hypothetical protein